MAKINIPFMPDFEDAMLSGRKTATTRTKKYGDPGDVFTAFGADFMLRAVRRVPLETVALEYFRDEGFDSPEEFIATWNRIHPRRGFRIDDVRWLHQFEMVNS